MQMNFFSRYGIYWHQVCILSICCLAIDKSDEQGSDLSIRNERRVKRANGGSDLSIRNERRVKRAAVAMVPCKSILVAVTKIISMPGIG